MSLVKGLRSRAALERRAVRPRGAAGRPPISIELARRTFRAGETVVALVDCVEPPGRVALVRVERRPCGEGVVVVDAQDLGEPYAVVELALPPGALPTAAGDGCALSYGVQVRAHGVVARAGLEVSAKARPHVAVGSSGGGPLIAGWDARHFHLELEDAVLRGGGWIAARVHRHGSWCSRAVEVRCCCDECWRRSRPVVCGMPYWHEDTLWAAEGLIELEPDAHWTPLRFDLPPDLPPAVEARTIAWRYELRARVRRNHRPDETAALTPLLHDERAEA
jgi:hypothetical protein